jgi:hypothetical protein
VAKIGQRKIIQAISWLRCEKNHTQPVGCLKWNKKNKAPNPGEVRCLRCALRALASRGKADAQRVTSRLDRGTRDSDVTLT